MTERDPRGSARRPAAHEAFEELAVGHALSALEPEDEETFLAHLPGCAACQRDVADHRETLAHLAYIAVEDDPPPSLLAGIHAGVIASGRAATFPEPVSLERARARRVSAPAMRRGAALLAAAAAVAVIAGLGLANRSLTHQRETEQALSRRLTSTVQELKQPGSRTLALAAPDSAVKAVAVVHGASVSLVVDGLAPNDRAHSTYVLWSKSAAGQVRPVGTFDVRATGLDVVRGLRLAAPAVPGETLAVTKEPSRVAPPLPTTGILVAGQLT